MNRLLLVLLIGGWASTAGAQTGAWQQKSDIGGFEADGPRGKTAAVGFGIGDKGYTGTGLFSTITNTNGQTKDFDEYDPSTRTWQSRAVFGGSARAGAVGFSIGSKGFIGTGGDTSTAGFTADFWEYDPGTDSWSQKADFGGGPRISAVGFSIAGKGYIGTGVYRNQDKADFWEYDTTANTWTRKADFPGGGRYSAIGFGLGKKGYVGTGNDPVETSTPVFYADFWQFDPATDTWTRKADFGGGPRAQATGFAIGRFGYMGTGNAGIASDGISTEGQKDFWQYDPATDTWTRKADLTGVFRWSATGFSAGHRGYIGMGYSGACRTCGSVLNDFWQYDPATDAWRSIKGFEPEPRAFATGFAIGRKGYLGIGGRSDFWAYDTLADYWTQKADFPGPVRTAAAGFTAAGKGYIATGGHFNVTYYNDCWQYDPVTNSWTQKADLPASGRTYAVAFGLHGEGYLGTGATNLSTNTFAQDFWQYDPSSDTWTRKANFAGGTRYQAVGFSIRGKGFIGTGMDTGVYLGHTALIKKNDFWEYEPRRDRWVRRADFGGGNRIMATGFGAGDQGYLGTGLGDSSLNYLRDFWTFDPAANSWTRIADLPGPGRSAATAFSIGAAGYAGGGNAGNLLNDWWRYVPAPTATLLRTDSALDAANLKGPAAGRLIVYPNPVADEAFLTVNARSASKALLTVTAAGGREVTMETIYLQKGSNSIRLATGDWITGIYYVRLGAENTAWQAYLVKK